MLEHVTQSEYDFHNEVISSILYDRMYLYEKALEQQKINEKNVHIKFGMSRDIMNVEKLFEKDMISGDGLILDTSVDYKQQDNDVMMIASDSIHSYQFGVRSSDTKYIQNKRFVCECGRLKDSVAGIICPHCGSPTELLTKIRGWFILPNDLKVFNPDWLRQFMYHINTKLSSQSKLMEGIMSYSGVPRPKNKEGTQKYNLITLQDKKVLADFIEDYAAPAQKEYFLSNIDKAMTNKIMVISKDFRYYNVEKKLDGSSKVDTHELNKHYVIINDKIKNLKNMTGVESKTYLISHLAVINQNWLDIYNINKNTLGNGKKSMFRGKTGGRRKGTSGRLVVEGIYHPRVDVATVPYTVFGEVTIDHHLDLYLKYGMTPESEYRMRNNFPNEKDRKIMVRVLKELKEQKLNFIFVYRAPTIYMGSLVALEIIGLTHDNTIRVNEITLDTCMAGDKDGDILGFFILPASVRLSTFFTFNPKRQSVNPITGFVNSGFELVESIYMNTFDLFDEGDQKDHTTILSKEEISQLVK